MPAARDIALTDQQISQTRRRIEEQKARLGRLIVQGAPTQRLEDTLRKIEAILRALQEHRRIVDVAYHQASHLARVSEPAIASSTG
jgi:hypothetical protein